MTKHCPNCHQEADGLLYSSELYAVVHCGCFYEASPEDVLFHVSREDSPELIEAKAKARSLASRCLQDLGKGWDEAVVGLEAVKAMGASSIVSRAYVARLAQLATLSYGPLDLGSLIHSLRRKVLR